MVAPGVQLPVKELVIGSNPTAGALVRRNKTIYLSGFIVAKIVAAGRT